MTASELKINFNIELDAVSSGAAPGFTDAEINALFIKVERDIIEAAVKSKDFDSIYTLVETAKGSLASGNSYANSYKVLIDTFADNFLYYVTSRTYVNRTNPTFTGWVENDLIQRDIADKFATTGFNYPYFKNPVLYLEQWDVIDGFPSIVVMLDYYSIPAAVAENVELTYIRIPDTINVASTTSELPSYLHKTLVTMAVQEAVKSLKIAKVSTQ